MGKATQRKAKVVRHVPRAEREFVQAQDELAALEAQACGASATPALRIAIERKRADVEVKAKANRWGHKQGTPETLDKFESVPMERRQPPLAQMAERGELTGEQEQAYKEIQAISEAIKRSVEVRVASIEARVDCSGSARDSLVEGLARIRLERAFSQWRTRIPAPRQMICDVIECDRTLLAAARAFRCDYRTIRKRVLAALDLWTELKEAAWDAIDEDDVNAIYARLGCGELIAPMAKAA